jgi:HEAT repeat protein
MMNTPGKITNSDISTKISDLASHDQEVRQKARSYLTKSGESSVDQLIEALSSSNANIRTEAGKLLEDNEYDWSKHTDTETLNTLTNNLTSNDGFVRLTARNVLIKIGPAAVSGLIKAIAGKQVLQRWESAKALSQIADPAALQALVAALDDKVFDVRWVAAEGLIAIGRQSIKPLLHLLIDHPDSIRLREGVHHVLHALNVEKSHEILKPVLEALESPEAPLQVAFASEKALKQLN